MMERAIQFGAENGLSGVFAPADGPSATAALLFNAGILRRVGAHRLNVTLARRLAAAGLPALRFDLSGLGDSAAGAADRGYEAQTEADMTAAMDWIEGETGARRFVLIGLCSGADNAFRTALRDPRVAGLGLLGPWSYPAPGAELRHIMRKAQDPAVWGRQLAKLGAKGRALLGGGQSAGATRGEDGGEDEPGVGVAVLDAPQHAASGDATSEPAPAAVDMDLERGRPERAAFAAQLSELLARGVKISVLYTADEQRRISAPEQFAATFPEVDLSAGFEIAVRSDVGHTLPERATQAEIVDQLIDWSRRV